MALYRHEHFAVKPRGWRVRTVKKDNHLIRVAFPPGGRRKGSGKLIEVLHPRSENPEHRMNPMAAARLAGESLARRGENPGELVVFGLAGNPGGRKRRRNPSDEIEQGVELFEKFHGSPVNEIVKLHESAMIRQDYVACGPLIEMEVKPKRGEHYLLSFPDDGVMLACTVDGKQLYCIGGNQDVSECISKLPGDPEKDFFHLGEVRSITYFDQKAENGHKPTEWEHALGEEGGTRPHAMFDRIRKRIYFIGGDYRIEGPWIRN